jgi:adenine-specific DNA-methyltransferase
MTNELQKVKDDLIAELDKRIADQIIEQTNADLLKKLITNAETINEAIMIAELGTTYKRTGFHFDKRLEKMTDTIKYFKKNEKLSFVQDPNALTHKLIIGDNYDALLNLLIQYRGKIDVIYIDPPYGKDAMGEFAKTNYDNAITRDNLLSMLYPRLVLARQLLCDNGVIFCSIDDKNQAYVKGLFDEVFGEGNFVATISRATGTTTGQDANKLGSSLDYLLMYQKTDDFTLYGIEMDEKDLLRFNQEDEKGKFSTLQMRKTGNGDRRQDRPNMYYPVLDPNGNEVFPVGPTGYESRWRFEKKTYERMLQNNMIIWKESRNGKLTPYVKYYLEGRTKQVSNLWDKIDGNKKGSLELKEVLGGKFFDNPKPTQLIKKCISIATTDINSIILDFFAGSGTTGQAVLELNKQDGGKRQFILVNANEITDTTPNGIVYDVTSKRLKRVMTGECYDGTRDFKWNEKNEPLGDNLDVYDIATVANFEATEGNTPFEVIDETLYGQEKLGVQEKIKWVCEHFEHTQKKLSEE